MPDDSRSFTGRERRRRTTWRVRAADVLARTFITIGGIGTIACVLVVCLFLVWVVVPLFGPAKVENSGTVDLPWKSGNALLFRVDEHRVLGWNVDAEGRLHVFRLDNGEPLGEPRPTFETTARLAAIDIAPDPPRANELQDDSLNDRSGIAAAFDDGTVGYGRIAIKTDFVEPNVVPDDVLLMPEGAVRRFEYRGRTGVVERTPLGQYRMQSVVWEPQPLLEVAEGPVRLVDLVVGDLGPVLAVVADDAAGRPHLAIVTTLTKGTFTKRLTIDETYPIPVDLAADDVPSQLHFTGRADKLFAIWPDGRLLRFDTRTLSKPVLAEELDVAEGNATVTATAMLLGRETLVVGDSEGRVSGWFVVRVNGIAVLGSQIVLPPETKLRVTPDGIVLHRANLPSLPSDAYLPEEGVLLEAGRFTIAPQPGTEAVAVPSEGIDVPAESIVVAPEGLVIPATRVDTADGARLVRAHELPAGASAATSIGVSSRTRSFAVGFEDGTFGVYLMTTDSRFHRSPEPFEGPIGLVALAPKDDAIFVATGGELWTADFDRGHPEITLASLFRPVWYEGYPRPSHDWQSSSSTQSFEPKYGLVPLVFGSLKATFYSLLFGVPLALFAAIYSSEFLHPRTKARVKPTIEIMASLPSVVLGFLAALVFAPVVERFVPAVLAAFVTLPLAFVVAAKVSQSLPDKLARTVERWRFPLAFLALPAGLWAAWAVGPTVERLLFDGKVMLWLNDPNRGSGLGAWLILLLPFSALVTMILSARVVQPRLLGMTMSRAAFTQIELLRFVFEALFVVGLAIGLSWFLTAIGWDPRGSYVGTYVQRNALVVGFVMGFAIIPIIYTIADDALSAVPENLRAASLGAGATPWQTTTRIVVPTATSGLFSAIMIGLGRAVGETMIVLMAAGNTPIMDLNVFNGFRTLSANIAVELPEASKDGTHYRTLFLAALVLFILTFIVNTIAEFVRLRFRKRVVQL